MHKLKKYSVLIGILLVVISFVASCATLFKGQHADIRVNSQPSGAKIFMQGINQGNTPKTLALQRGEDHILTLKKDGYEPVKVSVKKNFDGLTTILGNVVSFGLVGIVVDFVSGAAYSLKPADINQSLSKMKNAGIIDYLPKKKKGEITVVMLTKEQWNKVQHVKN